MWRCNRICTWTEKVNCIVALDALASWAAGWDHHCHECYAVATNLSLILQCWRHDKLHIRWNWIRYLISINKWTAVYGFTLLCITHVVISRSAYVLKCDINHHCQHWRWCKSTLSRDTGGGVMNTIAGGLCPEQYSMTERMWGVTISVHERKNITTYMASWAA